MKNKVARTMNVFINLTEDEQTEVLKEIEKYLSTSRPLRKSTFDSITEQAKTFVSLGPVPGGRCNYCGR